MNKSRFIYCTRYAMIMNSMVGEGVTEVLLKFESLVHIICAQFLIMIIYSVNV